MPQRIFELRLGRRLRAARVSIGLDLECFAAELGLERGDYARYEQGGEVPDLRVIIEIAELTGKSLDFLLTGRMFGQT